MKMRVLKAVVLLQTLLFLGCERPLYQSGRDTYRSFGNGRFQLMSGKEEIHLHDFQTGLPLVENVTCWRKEKALLYLVADQGKSFYVVNYSTGECCRYQALAKIPETKRLVFLRLLR